MYEEKYLMKIFGLRWSCFSGNRKIQDVIGWFCPIVLYHNVLYCI